MKAKAEPLTRSQVMARVRARDTAPEMLVRRMLHAVGYRYRVQARGLPGRPDLAFTRRKAAVFVHGCFWHGHDCARGAREPKTNADYWRAKIARNGVRDASVVEALAALGWRAVVVWECEAGRALPRLRAALGPPRGQPRRPIPGTSMPTRAR